MLKLHRLSDIYLTLLHVILFQNTGADGVIGDIDFEC